jgi:glycosyltransferase involved in cell wall biosynthesis
MTAPRISVITPSYNQGRFIEETIVSVIGQNYPNLEYIIIDGGSTDNSVDIIKKYEDKLAYWISEKDHGQAHAINKGFEKATGDIICWLNSDDMLLPGALGYVAQNIDIRKPALLFGNCIHFKEGSSSIWGSEIPWCHSNINLSLMDYIIQPSAFWTKKAWTTVGQLDETLHFTFDWEWFLRARAQQVDFIPVPKYLSMYRFHADHKTGVGGEKRKKEIFEIFSRFNPPEIIELWKNIEESFDRISQINKIFSKIPSRRLHSRMLRLMFPKIFKFDYDTVEHIRMSMKDIG